MDDGELLGLFELAELLGLSRQATHARTTRDDFPQALARLRSGPVWRRNDVLRYCRERSEKLVERPSVTAAAEQPFVGGPVEPKTSPLREQPVPSGLSLSSPEGTGHLSLEQAAAMIGAPAWQIKEAIARYPSLPVVRGYNGEVFGVPREALGVYARAVASGRQWAEYA